MYLKKIFLTIIHINLYRININGEKCTDLSILCKIIFRWKFTLIFNICSNKSPT